MDKRFAVVEFGTRGVRLLVADASPAGISQVIHSTGGFSELGRNQDDKGNLAKEAFELSKKQATKYVQIAQQKGAKEVFGFATEAVRSAPNRQDFFDALSPIVEVKVLEYEEEALCSFIASVETFRHYLPPQKLALVIDQGGGSIELAYGYIDEDGIIVVRGRGSFPLGTVRLTKQFAEADSLQEGFSKAKKMIQKEISKHTPFKELIAKKPFATFGLGSAITKLAEGLNAQVQKTRKNVHGQFIDIETIRRVVLATHKEVKRSKEKIVKGIGVDGDKATLIGGVLTFHDVLNLYNCKGVTVSRRGLRYGVLLAHAGLRYRIENSDV